MTAEERDAIPEAPLSEVRERRDTMPCPASAPAHEDTYLWIGEPDSARLRRIE